MTTPRADAADPRGRAVVDHLATDLDAGFVQLVDHYGRTVHSVALRVTGHPLDAEDLSAEAFLRAYAALRGYPPERIAALQVRAWLVTILLNVWRNMVRDRSRRPALVTVADVPDRRSSGPSIEDQVEQAENGRVLGRLVTELPAQQRVAVVLRHIIGLPVAEIASILECPEGTVKSHVSRGLQRLRTQCALDPAGAGIVLTAVGSEEAS